MGVAPIEGWERQSWRRDNDLYDLANAFRQKITGRRSIIGAIGNKLVDEATDLRIVL
jgi:hypothetical protein